MPRYKINIPLSGHTGAKTGRTYTCTRGAIYTAPEGEFKDLAAGHHYSRLDPPAEPPQDAPQDAATPDDSSTTTPE